MKKLFIFAAVAALSAGLVFVACKKESANIDKVATEQVVKHQKTEGDSLTSTYFISENGPDGQFYDVYGNPIDMTPTFDEPVGTGSLSSIANVYYVSCDPKQPATNCGTVWVNINGVDHKGVYWCTPDRERYEIDLSWHLN
ncbi:MAG: hypothetical protein J5701_02970 [Bacteroidales bacterium]|nr:hypothetical protein [Bacteroidales bacterium]